MRLLDRYLLRELLIPLGYCLSGFLLLWVSSDLINELRGLQEKKLLVGDVALYYLVKTPEYVVLVLPIGLLLALLYALTQHARHNEITAIRAAGVSLWRLCLPYFAVGFLASLALLAINELWAPNSVELAEQIRNRNVPPAAGAAGRDQVLQHRVENARDGRIWYAGRYDLRTGEMFNMSVTTTRRDGSQLLLEADRAMRTNGVWTFYHALERQLTNSLLMPLQPRADVLTKPEFTESPEAMKSEIALSAGTALKKAKRADIPIAAIRNYLRFHPHPAHAAALYTKLHGRLAAPWTCLVVVLIASPFGVGSGRRNVFVGVASSILICFSYFVVQQFCLALGAGGHLSPWLAGWFPNLAFGVAGLCLTARVR
jgi:lipopolysaccharide export system permease protein